MGACETFFGVGGVLGRVFLREEVSRVALEIRHPRIVTLGSVGTKIRTRETWGGASFCGSGNVLFEGRGKSCSFGNPTSANNYSW